MDLGSVLLVLVASVVAGVMNTVVGAGTIVTYPALVLIGVPPVEAIVANTVGIVPGTMTGAWGYRALLAGRWRTLLRLAAASATGGLVGAILLVRLPPGTVARVVPVLLVLAGLLAALQPRITQQVELHRQRRDHGGVAVATGDRITLPLVVAIGLTGVYGGYFGAAQGVLLLVALGVFLSGSLQQANAFKNFLAATTNLLAATMFILGRDVRVDWVAAAVVAVGSSAGSVLGARYGRRLSNEAMRVLIIVIAVLAAVREYLR